MIRTFDRVIVSRWLILELVRIRAMCALRDGDSRTFRRASAVMQRAARRRRASPSILAEAL